MRVAQLIHGLGLGGAQQVVRTLVDGRGDGVEHFVYSCHGGVTAEPIERAGATVRLVPRRLPKLDPLWARGLAREMRADGIDVVHGHLFGDTLHGYLAARSIGRLPMVMTLHNAVAARSKTQRLGYRWLLGRNVVPVACAHFVERSFADAMGARAESIRTIANGIAADALPSKADARARLESLFDLPPSARVLATVGRLAHQKNLPVLLDALERVLQRRSRQSVRLLIFGHGPDAGALRRRVARSRLAAAVRFAGFRDDVTTLLPGVDAIVFSSRWEGLPIALLEAMAAGIPTISTRVGGIPDVVEHDREGLLVEPDDAEALASAIDRLLDEPETASRWGEAARDRFERELTADAMVSSYESLYREIAGGDGMGRGAHRP